MNQFGRGDKNLILIPGLGMTWDVYQPFIEYNKDKFTMYIIGLPGFGDHLVFKKPDNFNDYSETFYIDNVVNTVSHLIDWENIGNPTIVGYFMVGCTTAIKIGLELPEKIESVIEVARGK